MNPPFTPFTFNISFCYSLNKYVQCYCSGLKGYFKEKTVTWDTSYLTYDEIINKVYRNFTLKAVTDSPHDYTKSRKTHQSFIYPTGVCQHYSFDKEIRKNINFLAL